MPRRCRPWNKPIILDECKAAVPKPAVPTYIDEEGRDWEVVLLRPFGGIGSVVSQPHDATHRGFRWTNLRRTYRFCPGDDRSMATQAIANQFACSRPTKTRIEALHEQWRPARVDDYAARVQEIFARRRANDWRV